MPKLQIKVVCQSIHQCIVWWRAWTFSCTRKVAPGALIKTWKAKKSVRWVFTRRQGANLLNGVSVSIPPNITAGQIGCQFHVMSWRRFRWRMVDSAPISFHIIILLYQLAVLCVYMYLVYGGVSAVSCCSSFQVIISRFISRHRVASPSLP